MKLPEAKAECERWFAYLKHQEEKATALARIVAEQRAGQITYDEGRRRLRTVQGHPTVYDGANLEKAVRVLLSALES